MPSPLPVSENTRHFVVATRNVDLLDLHRENPRRYPQFLESAASGPNGRFDVLFAFPGESLILARDGLSGSAPGIPGEGFLQSLQAWWRREYSPGRPEGNVPFFGGWFLYLGYELVQEIEPKVGGIRAPDAMPVAMAVRFKTAVIRDHAAKQCFIVGEPGEGDRVEAVSADIERLPDAPKVPATWKLHTLEEEDPQRYLHGVNRTLDYIRDGDVFQVNLSREWRGTLDSPMEPASLYQSLRTCNPSPFAALADLGPAAIICSSPERLVRIRGESIETRPIAGTRPRGRTAHRDVVLRRELIGHPKERAEHIMLIDLERNDIGRVCLPGSVHVNELMALESYSHVHHIVSNVRGRLVPGTTPSDVIRAVFPGGTITGCPKVRCMEIIAELEQAARGAYTGSLGYLNRNGDMDLNILIRTIVTGGRSLAFRAGAGIVADSDPAAELEETRDKARGLLTALGLR